MKKTQSKIFVRFFEILTESLSFRVIVTDEIKSVFNTIGIINENWFDYVIILFNNILHSECWTIYLHIKSH